MALGNNPSQTDVIKAIRDLESGGSGGVQDVQLNGSSVVSSGVANIKALPNYSLNIGSTNGGNPRQVKFLSVNYTNYDGNNACFIKLGAMCSHGNGASYTFMDDIFIGVSSAGSVICDVYKYFQQEVTLDGVSRNYGDVFYTIDTTNKVVDFYILLGQYSTANLTPYTKIGATTTTGITQLSGTPTYYSSGTKVWANGNSTTYARKTDIPSTTGSVISGSTSALTSGGAYNSLVNKLFGSTQTVSIFNNTSESTPLKLKSGNSYAYIGFTDANGTDKGALGVDNNGNPVFNNGSDHKLAYKTDIPSPATTQTTNIATSPSSGSATTFSRSDHIHGISSSTITSALGFTPLGDSGKTLATSGGVKLSNGLIINWGKNTPSSGVINGSFTYSYGTNVVAIVGTNWAATNTNTTTSMKVTSKSKTSFTAYCPYRASGSGIGWSTEEFCWLSIGY